MSDVFHGRYFAPRTARGGPGRRAVVAAVFLHLAPLAALAANLINGAEPLPEYKVYRVDLYSPPPQELGEPEPPKTQPAIVKPPETKEVVVEKKPAPVKTPTKTVTKTPGTSETAKGRNPDPASKVAGEGLDVHMAGDEFPYPEYLGNIITQLNRYFRWNGPELTAQVGFEIMRDGSVRAIKVQRKSGNINFDLAAISAIEQAGKAGAFGPLPKGWVANRLPISFRFEPTGR